MLIQDFNSSEEFIAGDNSILRELLHPDKQNVELRYSVAHASVKPATTTLPHRLKHSEVYYILEGEGTMYIEDESSPVRAGQLIYIPPNAKQYIQNTGTIDLKFLCIVDPAWRAEDEEVV